MTAATDEHLAQIERSIEGMTSYNRSWVLNRDVASLIGEIKALKAANARLTEDLLELHYKHKERGDELAETKRLLHNELAPAVKQFKHKPLPPHIYAGEGVEY